MKKILFPIAIFAAVTVSSCVKENMVEPAEQGKTVLTAGIETKTVLQNDAQVLWTNGDKINVNGVESAALELDAAAAVATFTFDAILETPYKAVFPSSIYKDAATVTLPAYQSYTAGSFGKTAAPMAAVSDNSNLQFNNLCAVLKVTVNKATDSDHAKVAYVDFSGKAGEQVSGDFAIDFTTMTLTGASNAEADKKVRYSVSKTIGEEAFVMYIVVPAGEYAQGYTLRILDAEGHYMDQSKNSAQTLQAGKVYELPAFDFVPTGTELDVEIATAQDLIKFATDYNTGAFAGDDLLVASLSQDITFDAESSAAFAATGGIGVRSGDNANYFGGVFNGNGKTIKGYVGNIPLFAAIDSNGNVFDLTIDNTCSFTFDATSLTEMGTVVGYHKGLLKNIKVDANITCSGAGITASKQIGGICARIREGHLLDSEYTGDIIVPAEFSMSESILYLGGIVGWISNADGVVDNTAFKGTMKFAGHIASTDKNKPCFNMGGIAGINAGTISDCEVFGDKKTTINNASHSYTTGSIGNVSTQVYFSSEGGVAGQNEGNIGNCVNRANIINLVWRTGTDGTASDNNSRYLYVGGITGYNKSGEISGCTNYGFNYNRSTPRLHKHGGIVGYNAATVKDCVNESTADITVATTGQDAYSARLPYIGGVIGQNLTDKVYNVQNKGDINISRIENSDNSDVRVGGVIGYTSAAIDGTSEKNISNSGNITLELTTSAVTLGLFEGGVVGYTEASIKNVVNTGKITHKHTVSLQKLYISGVVGAVVSENNVEISGCRNEGEVFFNAATASSETVAYTNDYVGGILAYSTSNVAVTSCENAGYVHGGNGTRLNGKTLYVGGIVGYLMGNSSIASCTNTGNVYNDHWNNSTDKSLSAFCGGIAAFVEGTADNKITISDCSVSTKPEMTSFNSRRGYFGNIAGYAENATISGCSSDCNFEGSAYYIGGIAGWTVNSTVNNCTWTGTSIVSSQLLSAGGIVGRFDAGSVIDGCNSYLTTLAKGGAIAGVSVEGTAIRNCHYKSGLSLGICSDSNCTAENNTADL